MALPKLNDKPKYELTIPSTGKKVKFRPYLVKEEKILMMALESGDQVSALNSVIDTIQACVSEDIDRSKLSLFDIEYMFIKIRSKSVGEVSEIGIKCSSCSQSNSVEVDLDSVEVVFPQESKNEIEITDGISIKMKYPGISDVSDIDSRGLSETERVFALIGKCIESVTTEDEFILIKDTPEEEVSDFIESLSGSQFQNIKSFIDTIPSVQKEVKFLCQSCGTPNTIMLRGLDDFF